MIGYEKSVKIEADQQTFIDSIVETENKLRGKEQ